MQALQSLPNYSEIPATITDFFEYHAKTSVSHTFDPLRTITPTPNLPQQPVTTSPHMFSKMNIVPPMPSNPPQFNPIGKESATQKGVCLIVKKKRLFLI